MAKIGQSFHLIFIFESFSTNRYKATHFMLDRYIYSRIIESIRLSVDQVQFNALWFKTNFRLKQFFSYICGVSTWICGIIRCGNDKPRRWINGILIRLSK